MKAPHRFIRTEDYGEVHALATDDLRPEELSQQVEAFWREVRTALAAEDVKMSLLVTGDMITGDDGNSGINAALLARYADRVWTQAGEADYAALLSEAGMDLAAERLVLIGGTEGSTARMEGPSN